MSGGNLHDVAAHRRDRRRRLVGAVLVLTACVALSVLLRVVLGHYQVTLPDLVAILSGESIPGATFIVMHDKLPRSILAVLAGLAFGVSGGLFRLVLRNPLASPDILGITHGASAGAVVVITVLGARGQAIAWGALMGALTAAALITLASRSRQSSGGAVVDERFLLAGIAVAALGQAVSIGLLTRADLRSAQDIAVWTTGSLNGSTWGAALTAAVVLLAALPLLAWVSRQLQPSVLGPAIGVALGSRPGAAKTLALLTAVVLAACATALTGPLAFVALLATPIATTLTRGRVSLVCSGLCAALIILAADFVGAELFPSTRLPAGAITGAIGAPMMLWLLLSQRSNSRQGH